MPKISEITIEKRSAICTLRGEGYSLAQIGKKLNCPKTSVFNVLKKKEETGLIINKQRSGRKRVSSASEDTFIALTSKRNRRLTSVDITQIVNISRPIKLSVTTVKRRLQEAGLNGRIAARKPLLSSKNKKKRLTWAFEHKDWTVEQWKNVMWTDESKFDIFGSKRKTYVRRKPGERLREECIVPTIKHGGGSVMVWGCFAGAKVGDLKKIEGILRKEGYLDILQNNAIPSAHRICQGKFVFQQDNDPKHSSKLCRAYLESLENEKVCKTMLWPPQSPDLSPIELLWDEMDRKVRQMLPTSANDLWIKLVQVWNSFPEEKLVKLLQRMPRICNAVIRAKGNHINEKDL